MGSPVVGGLLACAGGAAVAFANFALNLRVLKKKPDALARLSIVRTTLNAAYLVLVFLLARVLPWDAAPLLIGAAAGLTVPSFLLSLKLAKINDGLSQKNGSLPSGQDGEEGKGEDNHG